MTKKNLDTNKSKLHRKCMKALKEAYPFEVFKENVFIKIDGNIREFDCEMKTSRVMVEFHGEQHFKQNALFHKDETDFRAQKRNDGEKALYCVEMGYTYVFIPFDADVTPEYVRNRIKEATEMQMEEE